MPTTPENAWRQNAWKKFVFHIRQIHKYSRYKGNHRKKVGIVINKGILQAGMGHLSGKPVASAWDTRPWHRVILGFCQNGSRSQVLLSSVSLHKSIMTLAVFGMYVTEQSWVPKYVPCSDKFKSEGWYDQQRQYRNACFAEAVYWQGTMTKF